MLLKARDFSTEKLAAARTAIDQVLAAAGVDPDDLAVVAVGSIGRFEALAASDIDVIPVHRTKPISDELDGRLRAAVGAATGMEVSKGEDLTRACSVGELAIAEAIGGEGDTSAALTKRILILTESAEAGGGLALEEVRRQILTAYSEQQLTRGRSVLSLCNDVARYYRTLCVEYKAKVDVHGKDWCTRNLKLRHSRKLWMVSCAVGMSSIADTRTPVTVNALLDLFGEPPIARLLGAVGSSPGPRAAAGRALDSYAWFLDFMSDPENRRHVSRVEHPTRYAATAANPFPALKFNSDAMHMSLRELVDALDPGHRGRLLDWFLF